MTPVIQPEAEADILRQVERYARQGLPQIARRFHASVLGAIDALLAMPEAGPPKATAHPRLAGLRTWPLKGFDEFRIYSLARPDALIVVRILHGKRDIGAILGNEGAI